MSSCIIKRLVNPVPQIPVGSGKGFTGVVDLLTNQRLIWKQSSMGNDGRVFESKPLDQSDEPELLQEAHEARTALIEQVDLIFIILKNKKSFFFQVVYSGCVSVFNPRLLNWMMSLLKYYSQILLKILMQFLQLK